jgi:GTPase
VRTYRSIQRCDVAMLVIDATLIMEGFSKSSEIILSKFKLDKQDVRILEDVSNFKKGLLIVVNKWDLIEKDSKTSILVEQKINEHLKSYNFLKLIFISALTKQRIHKVLDEAKMIYDERAKMIKTSDLNDKILEEIKRMPPQAARGREVKINYITQVRHSPPVIAFFVNEPSLLTENYKRYLEKKIREHFGFEGVPLSLVFKKKN